MQATITDDLDTITDALAVAFEADLKPGRGLNGYSDSTFVEHQGRTVARLLHGGNGNPHLIASGAATDDVVPVLRSIWTDQHVVTRMDTAQDFVDDLGGYDRLRDVMIAAAEGAGLSTTEMESTRNGVRSRTIYLGSPSSRVRVRLYEKGQFERQQEPDAAKRDLVPSGWVRMEAQIRPTGAARHTATSLDAIGAWGVTHWTRKLAAEVMNVEVERVAMRQRRDPDYERAVKFLRKQYGATLAKALEVEGSWDAVGQLLGLIETTPGYEDRGPKYEIKL